MPNMLMDTLAAVQINTVSASAQPACWPRLIFIVYSFSSSLPKQPASHRIDQEAHLIKPSVHPSCSGGLINTAMVDRECGCCGLPQLTRIMDQLLGHSGLIVPVA